MISLDTVREDQVDPNRTPFLAGLLDAGVALDDHRACSNWTWHSGLCALSGESAIDAGWLPQKDDGALVDAPHEVTWLAERLDLDSFIVTGSQLTSGLGDGSAGYGDGIWLDQALLERTEVVQSGFDAEIVGVVKAACPQQKISPL